MTAPTNLRLVKSGTRGRPKATQLYPMYIGVDDEGRRTFEVTLTRDELEAERQGRVHFVADEMPDDVDVRVRVMPRVDADVIGLLRYLREHDLIDMRRVPVDVIVAVDDVLASVAT